MFKKTEQELFEDDTVYLDEIREGMVLLGTVTAIEHFGAFIDVGGIVGLLHISNMNWGYTEDPWETLNIGDEIHTKVIAIDLNTSRFYLGLKQLTENPYLAFINQHPIGTNIQGVITAFTHTRIIIQLADGVKGGFIYSNLPETHKNELTRAFKIKHNVNVIIKGFNKENNNIFLDISTEELHHRDIKKPLISLLDFLTKKPLNSTTSGIVTNIQNNNATVQLATNIYGTFTFNHPVPVIGETVEVKIATIFDDDSMMLELEPINTLSFKNIHEGMILTGTATNILDYGVFINIGGISGLLHINEMAWKRPAHPQDIISIDDKVDVKIIKIDHHKKHISLSAKQLIRSPWVNIEQSYPIGTRIQGKVTSIVPYGCFIEIGNGIKGLLHQSDMLWENKKQKPAKMVKVGDKKEVMILSIDEKKEHISFGMKQCTPDPFELFASNYSEHDEIIGTVKDIKDYGIFLSIGKHINALVHYSNIAWDIGVSTPLKQALYDKIGGSLYKQSAVNTFATGEKITVVILTIDVDNKRIGLGIEKPIPIASRLPALERKTSEKFLQQHPVGSIVTGKAAIVTKETAVIMLTEGVVGLINRKDSHYCAKTNAATLWQEYFAIEEELTVKIIEVAEDGVISLAIPDISISP